MVLIMYKYHLKDVQWKEFLLVEKKEYLILSLQSGIDKK